MARSAGGPGGIVFGGPGGRTTEFFNRGYQFFNSGFGRGSGNTFSWTPDKQDPEEGQGALQGDASAEAQAAQQAAPWSSVRTKTRDLDLVAAEEDSEDEDDEDEDFTTHDPSTGRFQTVDIPPDAYGAAILAFTRDVPTVFACDGNRRLWYMALYATLFSMTVLTLNLMLQVSILMYVSHYVVNPDIMIVQGHFKRFRETVFDTHGNFQEDVWSIYDGRNHLCQVAMWNRPFYYAILFSWTLVMLIEIRKSEELTRQFIRVPSCNNAAKMIMDKDDKQYVVAFTRSTRVLILVFVALPKIAISLILLWLGCEWLSATIQFESLVMNTVAMAFIVNIDEILFDSILPGHHKEDVKNIDFLITSQTFEKNPKERLRLQMWAFRRSMCYIVATWIFLISYGEYMQDVLPPDISELKDRCLEYFLTNEQPLCQGWTWYFRGVPASDPSGCFPLPSATNLTGPVFRTIA